MASERQLKRIIIVIISLIIIAVIASLFYFVFKSSPTCFDGIKNQGEEDADCGGPCSSCFKPQNILVSQTKILKVRSNNYDIIALIKNPNFSEAFSGFLYEFVLYDASGEKLASKSADSYIFPGEEKYIIERGIFSSKEPSRVELKIADEEWQRIENFTPPQILIRDRNYTVIDNGFVFSELTGVLVNESNFDFDKILIKSILKNKFGDVLAVGLTELRTVKSGESRFFKVDWFDRFEGRVESFEITPETNLFLNENFLKRQGIEGKFRKL